MSGTYKFFVKSSHHFLWMSEYQGFPRHSMQVRNRLGDPGRWSCGASCWCIFLRLEIPKSSHSDFLKATQASNIQTQRIVFFLFGELLKEFCCQHVSKVVPKWFCYRVSIQPFFEGLIGTSKVLYPNVQRVKTRRSGGRFELGLATFWST